MSATVHLIADGNITHSLDVIEFFFKPGDVIEIRALGVGRNASHAGAIYSGYFNIENRKAIAQAIRTVDGRCEGVYFTINRLNPELLARANNRLQARPKNTTTDADILERYWLYIDVDSIRPAGISANEKERRAALACAKRIQEYLDGLRWPEPFSADSGNGGHLEYRLPSMDLAKSDEVVKRVLQALDARFSDDAVKVDTGTANRARICKLYGTMACKGDSTLERPHRRALGLKGPEPVEAVPIELLEQLAAEAPAAPRPTNTASAAGTGKSAQQFDIDGWLLRSALEVTKGPEPYNGGRKWTLRACPFSPEHQLPVVIELPSGALVYKCLHKSCEENNWRALRDLIEPDRLRSTFSEKPLPKPADVNPPKPPTVFNVGELMALEVPPPELLVEGLLPKRGVVLAIGKPKSGKTLLAVQLAIAVASGRPLFDTYRILEPGPALIVEQDDPSGPASIKHILGKSPVPVTGIPFFLVPKVPFCFGMDFLEWLERQIQSRCLRLVVLDSYTALRAGRTSGCDLVKIEQTDMLMLDELAKRTGCTVLVIHHASKSSVSLDWSEQGAGSFAMTAAVESQIHVSRYGELAMNAPERLVRVQGRHLTGTEFTLRFRKETLDYAHILEGGSAPLYPAILVLKSVFGAQPFSPKEFAQQTGISPATAHRQIERLRQAGAITKRGFGEYSLDPHQIGGDQ